MLLINRQLKQTAMNKIQNRNNTMHFRSDSYMKIATSRLTDCNLISRQFRLFGTDGNELSTERN